LSKSEVLTRKQPHSGKMSVARCFNVWNRLPRDAGNHRLVDRALMAFEKIMIQAKSCAPSGREMAGTGDFPAALPQANIQCASSAPTLYH